MIHARATLLIALLAFGSLARATPACAFVPRESAKSLLAHLPPEVIGYENCAGADKNLRGIFKARFNRLNDQALQKFMDTYARIAIADARRSYIVKQGTDADGRRQLVFETLRPGGSQPMWHYVFTSKARDGEVVVYIHTSGAKESRSLRTSLQAVRHELTKQI